DRCEPALVGANPQEEALVADVGNPRPEPRVADRDRCDVAGRRDRLRLGEQVVETPERDLHRAAPVGRRSGPPGGRRALGGGDAAASGGSTDSPGLVPGASGPLVFKPPSNCCVPFTARPLAPSWNTATNPSAAYSLMSTSPPLGNVRGADHVPPSFRQATSV